MDPEAFAELLRQPEGPTLDFKQTGYDFSEDRGKLKFVKDIVSFANTPRDSNAYIVIGVGRNTDGTNLLIGACDHPDDELLQSQVAGKVWPVPQFHYEVVHFDGAEFGLIVISDARIGPCMPLRDFDGVMHKNVVYFRRGSKNDAAGNGSDLERIVAWCKSGSVSGFQVADGISDWDLLRDAVHDFDPARSLVLVAAPIVRDELDWSPIGLIPWSAVFDFDPESDSDGLLSKAKQTVSQKRQIYPVVERDRPSINVQQATRWFFARGLRGRAETVEIGPWRTWQRRYAKEIEQQLENLAGAVLPRPTTFVIAWYSSQLTKHLDSFMGAILSSFGELAEFVVVCNDPSEFEGLRLDYEAKIIAIRPDHLLAGLRALMNEGQSSELEGVYLPASSGVEVALDLHNAHWIAEEIELVHRASANGPYEETQGRSNFLRGGEASWYELSVHSDVDRDVTAELLGIVSRDLATGSTTRVNLHHAAGAGGTTIGRRIVWDLRSDYPAGLLHMCADPHETVERISRIFSITGKTILLCVDSSEIAENKLDKVFEYSRARNVPVVILQVLRRQDAAESNANPRTRSRSLVSKLSDSESNRFVSVLSREVPQRRSLLEALRNSPFPNQRTAFYFCLQAFEDEFQGLEKFVRDRIKSLTAVQRQILGYMAMAHHYGQRPMPEDAFRELLGFSAMRLVRLESALPPSALELIVQDGTRSWRTAHDLVARELLTQILGAGSGDLRTWKQKLSDWAIEFADLCRGRTPVPSEQMLETVRRIFVYRDNNVDVLGTERSGQRQLSYLLEDIPSDAGRLRVLDELVRIYPEEAHFWAHLGRFHFVRIRDYEAAASSIDHAIALRSDDHVLHHMRGMADRARAYDLIEKKADVNQVSEVARQASKHFAIARELEPEDDHGYISEVQMLARTLDYAVSQNAGGLPKLMTLSATDSFLIESLQQAEDLLAQVRRNREGEGPSQYEARCRADLDTLYGRHDVAIQTWDSLLSRPGVYAPPLRRQIAWAYLARRERSWSRLDQKEVDRIVDLMRQNLEEKPDDDKSLRLWLQSVRYASRPPSLDEVLERVTYWKINGDSLEAVYYLYVLQTLRALEGSGLALEEARRSLEECRNRARYRRNRAKSYEWLGDGQGLARLVHQSLLGEWNRDQDFWTHIKPLERVGGLIASWEGPQAGSIEFAGGLRAFFVPAKGRRNGIQGLGPEDKNQQVTFFLGFSYDGLRAWDVTIY